MDELFSKALTGFMLVLSGDGNMVYLSENVSEYLGISQVRVYYRSAFSNEERCIDFSQRFTRVSFRWT